MRRVDFYISNPNHHWQMMRPVMVILKDKGVNVRLVSLCEFRRMDTPKDELNRLGIPYFILQGLKYKGAGTSTGSKGIGGNKAWLRNALRLFVWMFLLKRSLHRANGIRPDLVVVPNDIAFPFDRICRWFKTQNIPFILLQEGIRFPLPNEEGSLNYGTNGAKVVFAWGDRSATYFKSLHIAVDVTGNPRYDVVVNSDLKDDVNRLRTEFSYGRMNVLFASNPVDDQGFCSKEEKESLFRRFISKLNAVRDKNDIKVFVRLHPREDSVPYQEYVRNNNFSDWVYFAQQAPLFPLLKTMNLTVILASTLGLESLMMGTPIAVIKIPGHDYIFDYVDSGAAFPIDLDRIDFSTVLNNSLNFSTSYVNEHLANRGNASECVADNVVALLNS